VRRESQTAGSELTELTSLFRPRVGWFDDFSGQRDDYARRNNALTDFLKNRLNSRFKWLAS